MDNKFQQAVEVVLEHEGGYVNDPDDPGGETKYGISSRAYPNVSIANLSIDDAKQIYYEDYWKPQNYDKIVDLDIATKVFDLAVNMGPSQANSLLQKALHAAGERVQIDGIIGPQTIGATDKANNDMLIGALRAEAANYYRNLIKENKKLEKFIDGWLNRAYS